MLFYAKVLNGTALTQIELQASSQAEAEHLLRARGLVPVSVKASQAAVMRRKQTFPLSLFSQELLTLLESGLNLVEAIDALSLRTDETQPVMQALLQALQQGKSFSMALEEQPAIFPVLYRATVRTAERTGDLSHALSRYIAYDNQLTMLKKKVVSASIYPVMLMAVGGLVILFLMGFVVPKFSAVYEGTGAELPWMSKLMLKWGTLMVTHGEQMLMAVAGVVVVLLLLLRQPEFKAALARALWRIPAVGARLQLYQLARFYRTLGMLLRGGTPIMQAMESVTGLLDDQLSTQMQRAQQLISQGQPVSQALTVAGMTTPIGERMLLVGERSGNIAEMMERIAAFYDEELARWIDWFTRLFEPLLMLFIGLVIGVVVLLLYMPIFELAGQIQ